MEYEAIGETGGDMSSWKHRTQKNIFGSGDPVKVVDDVIDEAGFGMFQVLIIVASGILWLSDGVEIIGLSILGPILLCEWQLAPWQEALITTLAFLGFFIGSPVCGILSDVYGRKKGMCIGSAWVLFYGILSAFAPGIVWLLILRFLLGLGLGSAAQAVTYFTEFTPTKFRGKGVVFLEVFFALGGSLAAVIALATQEHGWRVWLGLCALPSAIFLILSPCLPESPRFYLVTGQPKKAHIVLDRLVRMNHRKISSYQLRFQQQDKRGKILDLIMPGYERVSLLLAFLWVSSVCLYMGMVLMAAEFITMGTTCPKGGRSMDVLGGSDGTSCRLRCQELNDDSLTDIFITTLGELPGLLLTAMLVDLVGRKFTFVINYGALAVVFGVLLFCLDRASMMVALIAGRAISGALLQVAYLYTPEVYPTAVRSIALGMGSSLGRLGAMITPYIAQVVFKQSIVAGLCIYTATAILGAVCALLLPEESKGKKLK